MFATVNGYYNGNKIVLEEDVDLTEGQKVIVTVLDVQRKKESIDLDQYMGRGEKCSIQMRRSI